MSRTRLFSLWGAILGVSLAATAGLIVLSISADQPLNYLNADAGGPFWQLPISVWLIVAALILACLSFESPPIRFVSVVSLGLATIGILGYLEPLGVFHDSWQNVGLGQLAASTSDAGAVGQVPYFASSPVSFLIYGVLSYVLGEPPLFLRTYPLFCVALYFAGLYALALAFATMHSTQFRINRSRFGLMSVFAFFSLAPTFQVRINPAPQSLAFALMPFCLAALLAGYASNRFRLVALVAFVVIVFTHPITAIVTLGVGVVWFLLGRLMQHRTLVSTNTVILYACVFLAWLIYVGVWIIRVGNSFGRRMLEVFNSGQHATVTATSTETLLMFIWLHRLALVGTALLVALGVLLLWRAHRLAGAQLIAWLGIAVAWLPLVLFGEFADRGPLFASLPAALAIGFLLSWEKRGPIQWLVNILLFITALTGYLTAYPSHIGEVISPTETFAFQRIAMQSNNQKIIYGYAPPLSGAALPLYDHDYVRIFALNAADFSYDRLLLLNGVIVISDQMRQAAIQRGPQALKNLEDFRQRLLEDNRYELIFDNGSVVAFRARYP